MGLKGSETALTSMAQLVECHPAKQKVAGLMPRQGTCLGCQRQPMLAAVNQPRSINSSGVTKW